MNADPLDPHRRAQGRDWEKTLREGMFDLPEATWQRMENDMRGFLAERSREAAHPTPISWRQRLAAWMALPALRWSGVLASLGLIALFVSGRHTLEATPQAFVWMAGESIESKGRAEWIWDAGRCRISGIDTKLLLSQASSKEIRIVLERGEATFHVEHRQPHEAFSVKVGDCQVHVVGTTFSVGIDSLKQWVSVEEGRVRFESDRGQRFVDQNQSSLCRESGGTAIASISAPAVAPVPVSAIVESSKANVSSRGMEMAAPSCHEGDACIAELSNFVRTHPHHKAMPEVALRWARLASKKGDHRDALVAYAIALETDRRNASLIRLEWFRTKVSGLGQTVEVSDSLDRWIESLPKAGAIWRSAVGLRQEVARRMGDEATVERMESQLRSPPQAESGGR